MSVSTTAETNKITVYRKQKRIGFLPSGLRGTNYLLKTTIDNAERLSAINFTATFYSSHYCLPASLITGSGDHINVIGTEREKKRNNEIDEKVAIDGST